RQLDAVQVTGSRIPRAQVEGPAPITVINAEQIRSSGFTSVPDVLRAMTQNGGETQSQQSSSGADFSPGAQQVDLRGLGPNHTLVLVNGRRHVGATSGSSAVDVNTIPVEWIERVEVITGGASAVYGADAVAGVVNFIMKKSFDGAEVRGQTGMASEGGFNRSFISASAGTDFAGGRGN
ncbi:TonB-dependent receptor plug domain-containing protein, partial [Leptospira borgpetersenii serovar Ballum]|nr:TonB-dependent receptor plug domain-containing protein [Leptospira borgpetersenii serovar Ballum]